MLSLAQIIVYLLEGVAITIAIYLITKKQLQYAELFTLGLTIAVTFMILDLFAPSVGVGARQGAGFGLGFQQVAGNPTGMPEQYYGQNCEGGVCTNTPTLEGMDDPVALQYYQAYNPSESPVSYPLKTAGFDQNVPRTLEAPAIIREKFASNPPRSYTEVDRDGTSYAFASGQTQGQEVKGLESPESVLYSPLNPKYGYRHQLPQGWDNLEQPNIAKALKSFQSQC